VSQKVYHYGVEKAPKLLNKQNTLSLRREVDSKEYALSQ
jgi:hypothetical protein